MMGEPNQWNLIMFKAKVKVNPALQNSFVTIATNLVILPKIVGSSNQSLQTHKRVQKVSPRIRKDPPKDLPKARQRAKERWAPSPPKAPGKARQVRTTLLKEKKNQKLKAKQIGVRSGQKISNGPLKEESGKTLVSKVRSVSAVLLQHVWQWRHSHLNRSHSARRSWRSWRPRRTLSWPTSFWTMPFKWVCNKSAYDGQF